jgi:hypothetical protein
MKRRQAGFVALARISHHSSTVAVLCGIPGDFHSVRALNSVSTMPAHSPAGVVATNLPGADFNSSAGPKGGGQDARNKDTWDTTFHRLATKGGEKCGLAA